MYVCIYVCTFELAVIELVRENDVFYKREQLPAYRVIHQMHELVHKVSHHTYGAANTMSCMQYLLEYELQLQLISMHSFPIK